MSGKRKPIILLSTLAGLVIVVVGVAVGSQLWSKDVLVAKEERTGIKMSAVKTELDTNVSAVGHDLPELPNRLLESIIYDSANWPKDASRAVVNDSSQLRAAGTSRYGKLEILSQPGEVSMRDGGPTKYKGTYTVRYMDAAGKQHKLPYQLEQVLRQLPEPAQMRVIQLDNVDVLLFQPRYYRFGQGISSIYTTYAYAIASNEEAFPLQFVYKEKGSGLKVMDSFLFDMNGPIEPAEEALSTQTSFVGGRYEITWTLDSGKHQLLATAVKDRRAEYTELADITGRATKHIEQALGLNEVDYPEGKLSEDKLGELFTNKAWGNPGFRFLRKEFVTLEEQTGNPTRAFAWLPIDAAYTSPDTIRFTFTINLWYAIGLEGHLEVELKRQDDEWMIADFGTLETEKFDDPNAPYSGLLMEDPLE